MEGTRAGTATSLTYRPELDGIRGIAVIVVVLFHALTPGFSGGFVGVDIFFVLSGFLITSVVANKATKDEFSFIEFYERRLRRLMPALFLVVAFALAAGWFLLFPAELARLGKSAAASSLSLANFYFLFETGYFAPEAEETLLLHMWSLSVEEQFYLVWPIIVLVLLRVPAIARRVVFLFGLLALFTSSETTVLLRPEVAFFSPLSRAWELALGACLAFGIFPAIRTARACSLLSFCGIALIAYAVSTYSVDTTFPGLMALPPCLGTVFLIHTAREGNSVTRWLSSNSLVTVGRISYSLYLWHWPVFAFLRLHLVEPLGVVEAAAALAVSIALAFLSWRFVEVPLRGSSRSKRRSAAVIVIFVSTALLLAAGSWLVAVSEGFPQRMSPNVVAAEKQMGQQNPLQSTCNIDLTRKAPPPIGPCTAGAVKDNEKEYPSVVVWGDSNGDHFVPGLAESGVRHGFSVRQLTKNACPPLPGLPLYLSGARYKSCEHFQELAMGSLFENRSRVVVLAAKWAMYAAPDGKARVTAPNRHHARRTLSLALGSVVRRLREANIRVVVFLQVPIYERSPNGCLLRALWFDRDPLACSRLAGAKTAHVRATNAAIAEAATAAGAEIFDPHSILCSGELCATYRGETPLYFDRGHLSVAGSRYIGSRLPPALFGLE